MIPIQELISRIRWDREFGRGSFVLGYYDRLEDTIVRVPFTEIVFPAADRFAFVVLDIDGVARSIPYHRVREVYKDGVLIWSRRPE